MPKPDKLKMHSPDLTQENIARIRELFPNCVTETRDEKTGELRLKVDFDLLRQELSDELVEGPTERYRLDWPGKRAALLTANAPIAKTLRPCREESVNFDTTGNLFIEGDNLDALKLLQEAYLGKVKMIYIDPPYNTGKDFVYRDNFAEKAEDYLRRSNQKDDEGGRLTSNPESNGRFHSDWLSMMYPRLKLARNLLRDDGVLFISIDDNESYNLIKICCEIFGEKNYVSQICIKTNPRGRHLDKFIAKTHENIIIFTKNYNNKNSIFGLEKTGKMSKEYNMSDDKGKFRLLGLRNRNQSFNPNTRPNLYYPLYVCPETRKVSLEKDNKFTDEVWPIASDGTKTCWTWGKERVKSESDFLLAKKVKGEWRIYRKDYFIKDGEKSTTKPKSLWTEKEFSNDYGRSSVKDLFGGAVMDFPKSPYLIYKLIKISSGKNDLILDFFAGSATTAHAVMQLNAEDGGNRRFIMVQLPEPTPEGSEARKAGFETIADIAKERIRRAGKKILEGECHPDWNKDVGFRVLKVDTSNMKDVYYFPKDIDQARLDDLVDNIKPDRTAEDLLFQVLIDWAVEPTLPIERREIQGKEVFFVNEEPYDLIACFDTGITEELVKELAAYKPLRVVFRDSGLADDALKTNIEQIFRQLSPSTDVKVI